MNVDVKPWLEKAELDYLSMHALLKHDPPLHATALFHAQQCVEKLLKAGIVNSSHEPDRTHDLVMLSRALADADHRWTWEAAELRLLSFAAVRLRYPHTAVTAAHAENGVELCERVREELLKLLLPRA